MTLYLTAKTPIDDLIIDFIEVELASGKTVSLNWDFSSFDRCGDEITARYEGVCFGEESAVGKIEELKGMRVVAVGLYSESCGEDAENLPITITDMDFYEEGKNLVFEDVFSQDQIDPLANPVLQQLYDRFLASSRR